MSVALMAHAFKTKLQPGPKLVLLALCDHANDLGECFPSTNMLSEKSSLSARHVFNCLAELERGGFLTRENRPGRSTIYQITNPATWANPCNEFTPELSSPLNSVHTTPEMSSYPPLNSVHTTPEMSSYITIKEPSSEPSGNRKREKTAPTKSDDKKSYATHKKLYGECQRVKLTEAEFERLQKKYGVEALQGAIEFLDLHIDAKGKDPYASHCSALQKWVFDAVAERKAKRQAKSRASPAPADDMDAHYFATNTGRVKSLVFSQPKGEFDARHE